MNATENVDVVVPMPAKSSVSERAFSMVGSSRWTRSNGDTNDCG